LDNGSGEIMLPVVTAGVQQAAADQLPEFCRRRLWALVNHDRGHLLRGSKQHDLVKRCPRFLVGLALPSHADLEIGLQPEVARPQSQQVLGDEPEEK
jgi:hypothetical protein